MRSMAHRKEPTMNTRTLGFVSVLALAGGVLGGFLAGALPRGDAAAAGEAPPPVSPVAADEFRVVDQTGRTRARFGVDAKGSVALYLYDQDGKERARLGVFDDLTALVMAGKQDTKGSGLTVFDDGRAELILQAEGKLVHLPTAPGRHWVLWGQRMPFEVPIGTFPTQGQCEEQRGQRQETLTSWTLSCLPESVEPRRQ
jgi:hypothetical protein